MDVLFGNMEEVTRLSGEFLLALEEAYTTKQAPVGSVFVTFAPRIRDVYGVYCRSHDNASALYEKVRTHTLLKRTCLYYFMHVWFPYEVHR